MQKDSKSVQLRALQLLQLSILKKVRDVCLENDIRYYIVAGTLLGAVRHGGFIPWDDDIDIAMYRDDYDRFREIAPTELGEEFFVQTWENDRNYPRYITKVRVSGTCYLEASFRGIDMHHGVFVDIFPLDNISKSNGPLVHLRGLAIRVLRMLKTIKVVKPEIESVSGAKARLRQLAKLIIRPFTSMLSDGFLGHSLDHLHTMTNGKGGELTTCFSSGYEWRKEVVPNEVYGNGVPLMFEGEVFNAPAQWDLLLRRIYGDYMTPPPEEERVSGHAILKLHLGKYESELMRRVLDEGQRIA
ncbi:MAG: LicD family protein, partial [Firmicutes bacterium]|nr:LicD family protein [Bacillota bacterium]